MSCVLACAQWNEIRNGRLAMVAFLGFVAQHAATGKVGESRPHCTYFAGAEQALHGCYPL